MTYIGIYYFETICQVKNGYYYLLLFYWWFLLFLMDFVRKSNSEWDKIYKNIRQTEIDNLRLTYSWVEHAIYSETFFWLEKNGEWLIYKSTILLRVYLHRILPNKFRMKDPVPLKRPLHSPKRHKLFKLQYHSPVTDNWLVLKDWMD